MIDFLSKIRMIPDFPKPGITFYDITSLLQDPEVFAELSNTTKSMVPIETTKIVAIDARGFIIGSLLARDLNLPLYLARKPGKLPVEVDTVEYSLEYGSSKISLEKNVIKPDDNVLIVDDLLATGGTISAVASLVKQYNPKSVSALVWLELRTEGLKGRELLAKSDVFTRSVIKVF